MSPKIKKILIYLGILVLFALLGFSREFLFVNINNQLYKLYYGHSNLPIPSSLSFITTIDYTTLFYSKYGLTVLFFSFYLGISYLSVKIITKDKKMSRWIIYIYALLLILSAITMLYNYFINKNLSGSEYTFSRWLMGIAQSPLVAFFIIASHTLNEKIIKK